MRLLRFALALSLATLTSVDAGAYTFRTAADGHPLRWRQSTVRITVDSSIASIHPDAPNAVRASFAIWALVEGASPPEFVADDGVADALGYDPARENHCTVRYDEAGAAGGGGLAVTLVASTEDGTIVDADIVIHGGSGREWTVVGVDAAASAGRYDVENVVTHEVGHFLGFAEELRYPDATMFPYSAHEETSKRTLAPSDEEGLRLLYPPDASSGSAAACAATGVPATPAGTSPWPFAVVAAVAALARRRVRGAARR